MKNILYAFIIILTLASCDTPQRAIGNPDAATNTSGTAGSANMTNRNNGNLANKTIPGTPTDSTLMKKDTLRP